MKKDFYEWIKMMFYILAVLYISVTLITKADNYVIKIERKDKSERQSNNSERQSKCIWIRKPESEIKQLKEKYGYGSYPWCTPLYFEYDLVCP